MTKQTVDNLKAAFAGESQARNFYTFWAGMARKEGWIKIAEVFEETAKNEKEHAEIILKLLNGINTSGENLKVAIDKESYEYADMYPEFERIAREEGFTEAANFFKLVAEVEKHHAERFRRVLGLLNEEKLLKKEASIKWKCRECGYIAEGNEPPHKCPLCGHDKSYYEPLIEEY
ncbi:rubrerythrin family protein [Zhaonella formicivorans]|jgi:rubrerythrin|uniref:rubrerythrin family protein n=1 Tax=Zhaonella formicivorans TaxID=2528593 RepID=UPI0010DDF015|nr:rubrerythrin family protein [Zhaonella formicivorans]